MPTGTLGNVIGKRQRFILGVRLETWVNGEMRQSGTATSRAFSFAWIIEYVSTFTIVLLAISSRWALAGASYRPMADGRGK